MEAALDGLRQALSDLALPTATQIAMFDSPNQAISKLKRHYETAHAQADVSRSALLSAEQRRALDEFLWDLTAQYDFEVGIGRDPRVKSSTDQFLQESEFWTTIRRRAREALSLLGP